MSEPQTDVERLLALADNLADCCRADGGELDWAASQGYMIERSVTADDDILIEYEDFEIGDPIFEWTEKGNSKLKQAAK